MKDRFNKFLCKIHNFMDSCKRNLKKSEIAIYAIALMLVAAGYYNYKTFSGETLETATEPLNNTANENVNIGDAVLVSNNETQSVENSMEENVVENEFQNVIVNSSEVVEEVNYFASTKLDRDKMYAEMISNYEAVLNNPNASETR